MNREDGFRGEPWGLDLVDMRRTQFTDLGRYIRKSFLVLIQRTAGWTSLVVQWLGLHSPNAGARSSVGLPRWRLW